MSTLVHLIYASTATEVIYGTEFSVLLSNAREKNKKLEVTGMLLHAAGNFFQVLEGSETAVNALYDIICRDTRHKNATQIIYESIAQRSFKDWSMGFLEATLEDLQTIEGLNDFFREGHVFTELENGRAKKLIAAFKEGRWRQSIKY